MFAAYFLAEQGYRPLVLERGKTVRERIRDMHAFDDGGPHDPESNYLFGEGGAGTFSDGKLTCRSSAAPTCAACWSCSPSARGKPSIRLRSSPAPGQQSPAGRGQGAAASGSKPLGGEFRFDCRVEDLDLADGTLRGLATSSGYLPTSLVVLAIGHSARDTYEMLLRRGRADGAQAVSARRANRAAAGAGEPRAIRATRGWKTSSARPTTRWSRAAEHNLFTFCMCAGGYVMPSVSRAGPFLHQRHEPLEARFAVRQQRADDHARARSISAARTCWPA